MSTNENVPSPPALSEADQKKALAKAKLDFQLHVALIQRTDGVPKNKALFTAWLEGELGLQKRLKKS